MKTNEIIAGLRKLCEQGSQYRRTVCRLAADRLEEQNSKGVEIDQFNRWIPVTERLPEPFVSVLACIPSEAPLPMVHESYIADHDKWVCILTAERYKDGEVTHWMPLPQPPKEDV